MNFEELRALTSKRVRLDFRDGEIVEATLLGIDPVRNQDLTYEVTRVVKEASPPTRGTAVGTTCIAPLRELVNWTAI